MSSKDQGGAYFTPLSGGFAVSMGVFFVEFLETFESGRGETGWIMSLCGGLMYGAGIAVSYILHRTDERLCCVLGALLTSSGVCLSYFATSVTFLIFSYGITTGIGMSFVLSSCAVALNHHFRRGRGAAIAVGELGLTVGGLVFPLVLRYLIDTYSWRGAILISGGILLNILPLGLLFVPPTNTRHRRTVETKETNHDANNCQDSPISSSIKEGAYCDKGVLKRKLFVLYIGVAIVVAIGNAYVYAIIVDMGNLMGLGLIHSTYLVLSLSVANIVGVGVMAALLKIFWKGASWLYTANIIVMAVSMFLFSTADSYVTLTIFTSLYGLTAGGLYGTYIAVVTDLLDPTHYTVGTGITCSGYGAGTILSTPIAGWIKDSSGDYKNSFYVGGGLCLGSALVFGVALLAHRLHDLKRNRDPAHFYAFTVSVNERL